MNRRFYRSRTDTILGGVAAGLANYLNADPALVRIAWAVLTPLTGGAAFLAYIVAWIIVPEEPVGVPAAPAASPSVAVADGSEEARETAYARPRRHRHRRHQSRRVTLADGLHWSSASASSCSASGSSCATTSRRSTGICSGRLPSSASARSSW